MRRPPRTVAWTFGLVAIGVASAVVFALVAGLSLSPIEAQARRLVEQVLPADGALRDTRSAGALAQRAFLEAVAATDPVARAAAIDEAQQAGQRQDAAWARYVAHRGNSPAELELQHRYEAANKTSRSAGATTFGLPPTDPAFAGSLEREQQTWAQTQRILDQLQREFATPTSHANAGVIASGASDARRNLLLTVAGVLAAFLGLGLTIVRRAFRFERDEARARRVRALQARRDDLETRLQRGLEMESVETSAYGVVRHALELVASQVPVEMLIAESNQAHFRQVVATPEATRAACQVGAPGACPAASSGQTREFSDSRGLDACPYLRDHPDPVWAVCVPVSIAGHTNGVIHAQDHLDAPPGPSLTPELELIARKAGDRLGVLRVLSRTEVQAQVDPLTGLPNRRALEQRTHDLLQPDTPFVVAYADLDNFKDLNDLHGHDVGDRALRLFARVVRDSIRPDDIPARYGGEEFVVVLPDCTIVDARIVAERIRAQLSTAFLTSSVPPFTVSIGLAEAEPDQPLTDVVERADAALLNAKRLGRDRVLAAGEILDTTALPIADEPELFTSRAARPEAELSR